MLECGIEESKIKLRMEERLAKFEQAVNEFKLNSTSKSFEIERNNNYKIGMNTTSNKFFGSFRYVLKVFYLPHLF